MALSKHRRENHVRLSGVSHLLYTRDVIKRSCRRLAGDDEVDKSNSIRVV